MNHWCPVGTSSPLPCLPGTFMSYTGAAVCDPCVAGSYCPGPSAPVACPAGAYCPAGTGILQPACPVGTYSSALSLQSVSGCTACTAGYFCSSTGAAAVTGPCLPGYFCPAGSQDMYGRLAGVPLNICPRGSYCPGGTAGPIACPVGTYAGSTGTDSLNACTPCDEVSRLSCNFAHICIWSPSRMRLLRCRAL